jgi:hypothetical protein
MDLLGDTVLFQENIVSLPNLNPLCSSGDGWGESRTHSSRGSQGPLVRQ